MQKARISFKSRNGKLLAFNDDFDDFYTCTQDGVGQKLEAFVRPCFERIDASSDKCAVVLELGFGLGINFMLFAKSALQRASKRFYYIGYEKFYHSFDDIARALKLLGLECELSALLGQLYPPARHGIYRIEYQNITLDLVYGDEFLGDYDFVADYVFVDGFKSSTNVDFYTQDFWGFMRGVLRYGSAVFSYASNSAFKRALSSNGFDIKAVSSKYKRENIIATYTHHYEQSCINGHLCERISALNPRTIAIIGSGIAGASLAYELSKFGARICVFDKAKLASGASSNELGLLSALILKRSSHMARYHEDIYVGASRFYRQIGVGLGGCYEYAYDDARKARFDEQRHNALYDMNGYEAHIKDGGTICPAKITAWLLENSRAICYPHCKVIACDGAYGKISLDDEISLDGKNTQTSANNPQNTATNEIHTTNEISLDGVKIILEDQSELSFDIVIICTGSASAQLLGHLPLSISQGQVSIIKNTIPTPGYSAKSYITSSLSSSRQIIGATYDRIPTDSLELSDDDISRNHKLNLDNLSKTYPHNLDKITLLGHKVGNRSYSSDRFAIIGGIYDSAWYQRHYARLRFSRHRAQSRLPKSRLYASIAHGSRGFASAIMGARIITSSIYGVPSSYARSVQIQTHPSRFDYRKIIRS